MLGEANNDYKKMWDMLQERLMEIRNNSKENAVRYFETDDTKNYEEPIESAWFSRDMERVSMSMEIINIMSQIELYTLLHLKHEEKCKEHYAQSGGRDA